jgi:hypothetical protein
MRDVAHFACYLQILMTSLPIHDVAVKPYRATRLVVPTRFLISPSILMVDLKQIWICAPAIGTLDWTGLRDDLQSTHAEDTSLPLNAFFCRNDSLTRKVQIFSLAMKIAAINSLSSNYAPF